MHMQAIVRNNLQLYNELRRQGRSDAELALVKAAYELGARLYSGYHQSDGRPLVLHTVGVAGILALQRMPAEIIALGLIHNVYGNGNFGDGRSYVYSTYRRSVIVDAVGPAVADLVKRFGDLMSELFRSVERQAPVPAALVAGPKHKYPYLLMPMSARRRFRTTLSGWYRRYMRGEGR